MRELTVQSITEVVARLCQEANRHLPGDVREAISAARKAEQGETAKAVLDQIIDNYQIAGVLPICQDTGVACVFLDIGQEVHLTGGDLAAAVDEGVRRGYRDGHLRASVVGDPLLRKNTGDNTPAMLYLTIVPGEQVRVTVAPKGFGSENMSRVKMLRPFDGVEGVVDFVLETVELAGPNACPPLVVGVGLGGTFDLAAQTAKRALLRPLDDVNELPHLRELEDTLLERVNALGIGPQGFGGGTTALAVKVLALPTHIAGLPCAVNINCHVARHAMEVI